MCNKNNLISLGFTDELVEAGSHICQIYNNEQERYDSLFKYLLSGIQAGEKNACFSEEVTEKQLVDFFSMHNISFDDKVLEKAFILSGTTDAYFHDNKFDPDRMLKNVSDFYEDSVENKFSGARIIGEMVSEIEEVPGGERLLEYESKISILLRKHPVTCVCQYNANNFDGSTIMNVLKVHPKMIVHGSVINNPFYITPEEF